MSAVILANDIVGSKCRPVLLMLNTADTAVETLQ